MGVSPPSSKILPYCRVKMVVIYTSAGSFTGLKAIGELLLLKNVHRQKNPGGQYALTYLKNLVTLRPCE